MYRKKAYTLAEVLIVLLAFGIIVGVTFANTRQIVTANARSRMSVSAFNLLKSAVGNYIASKNYIESSTVLCKSVVNLMNVSDYDCSRSYVITADTQFNTLTPNFILPNGMKFFNFGGPLSSAEAIEILNKIIETRTTISELNPEDSDYNSTLNSWRNVLTSYENQLFSKEAYYVVFVDIDGNHGKGILGEDVIMFIINMFGEVLPDGVAGKDPSYIAAGYMYLKKNEDGTSSWIWVARGLSFQNAICKSGVAMKTPSYCSAIEVDTEHCQDIACRYKVLNK